MSSVHVSLEEWVEQFEWDSEDQQKGFLALVQDLRRRPRVQPDDRPQIEHLEELIFIIVAWMIQKDHESNLWFNDRIGDLDKKHTDVQAKLLDEIRALRAEFDELKENKQ